MVDGFWEQARNDVPADQNTEMDNRFFKYTALGTSVDAKRSRQVTRAIAEQMPEVSQLQEATRSEIDRLQPILTEEELRAALTSIRIELLKKKSEALADVTTWGRLSSETTRVWRYGDDKHCLFAHARAQSFTDKSPITGDAIFSWEYFVNYASQWLKSKLESIDGTNMLSDIKVVYDIGGTSGQLRCGISVSVFDS